MNIGGSASPSANGGKTSAQPPLDGSATSTASLARNRWAAGWAATFGNDSATGAKTSARPPPYGGVPPAALAASKRWAAGANAMFGNGFANGAKTSAAPVYGGAAPAAPAASGRRAPARNPTKNTAKTAGAGGSSWPDKVSSGPIDFKIPFPLYGTGGVKVSVNADYDWAGSVED